MRSFGKHRGKALFVAVLSAAGVPTAPCSRDCLVPKARGPLEKENCFSIEFRNAAWGWKFVNLASQLKIYR